MNGVVVAEPNAPFLKKWFFQGYQDFEVKIQLLLKLLIPESPEQQSYPWKINTQSFSKFFILSFSRKFQNSFESSESVIWSAFCHIHWPLRDNNLTRWYFRCSIKHPWKYFLIKKFYRNTTFIDFYFKCKISIWKNYWVVLQKFPRFSVGSFKRKKH